jgi:hypothetical protein
LYNLSVIAYAMPPPLVGGGSGVSIQFPVLPRAPLLGELDADRRPERFFPLLISIAPVQFSVNKRVETKEKSDGKISIALLAPLA